MSDQDKRWTLRLVAGGVAQSSPLVAGGRYLLGRATEAQVLVHHATVSRRHAELVVETDTIRLVDLGSANGSRAGGRDLVANESHELACGEIFSIGDVLGVVFEGAMDQAPNRSVGSEALADAIERAVSFVDTEGPFCVCTFSLDDAAQHLDFVAGLASPRAHVAALAGNVICVLLARVVRTEGLAWLEGVTAALVRSGSDVATRLASCPEDGLTLARLCPQALTPVATAISERELERGLAADEAVSTAMRKVHALVDQVAPTPTSIVILGETGVGKEVMARLVHARSERAAGPFMAINCAALSESLLESELFGYKKGAFTGAQSAKKGLIEAAGGGTLFLDELGEMPLATQAKLLRVLEERTVLRVGSVKPTPVDIRVVAATNRDLLEEIAAKRFRSDLYYRLNGMILRLPPLRERTEEIALLAVHFAKKASEALHRPVPRMTAEARTALEAYPWPGNIRELRNAVERMVLLTRDGTLAVEHLPDELLAHAGLLPTGSAPPPPRTATRLPSLSSEIGGTSTPEIKPIKQGPSAPKSLDHEASRIERERIAEALERCGGNQTRAAAILGLTRRALIGRMEKYDLPRPRK